MLLCRRNGGGGVPPPRPRRALGAPRTRATGGRFAQSFVELSMAGHSRGVHVFKVAQPDILRHDLHVQASFNKQPHPRRCAQRPQPLARCPRRARFWPLAHGRGWQKGKSSPHARPHFMHATMQAPSHPSTFTPILRLTLSLPQPQASRRSEHPHNDSCFQPHATVCRSLFLGPTPPQMLLSLECLAALCCAAASATTSASQPLTSE